MKTGKRLQTLQGHAKRVNAVLFSPDGRWMATAGLDRTVKLWDVQTGTELRELKGHTSAVNSLACTPDAQRLASADTDGGIKIWDPETGQEFLTLKGPAKALEISPDGRWLAGTDGSSLELWDGGQLKQHDDAEESERAGKK